MVVAPIIDPDIRKAHTLPSRYYTEDSAVSYTHLTLPTNREV